MNNAILIAPVIVLLGVVPTFAAAQQTSNTTLDEQEHCDLPAYPSCYSTGFAAGQHNTGNCPYVAPGANASFDNYCLGFHSAQLQTKPTQRVTSGQNNTGPNLGAIPSATAQTNGWTDFGNFGIINLHTGVLHNERGVFIPWSTICTRVPSQFLLQSCSDFLNPDGTLTPAGDHAVSCVKNGLAGLLAAHYVGLGLGTAFNILKVLTPMTGCNGIVDMNAIQQSSLFQELQQRVGGNSSQ